MKNDRLKEWTTALRTTSAGQTTGQLGKEHIDGSKSYCCLGLGCTVAGIEEERSGRTAIMFEGQGALPPLTFAEWLGLATVNYGTGTDVTPDWPIGEDTVIRDQAGYDISDTSCSDMNDEWEFTFEQIADILDYFGVRA